MTDTNQIDLQSLRIQAGYQAGHSMDTLIRSYAQNTAGALAVAEAQKVVAEEQIGSALRQHWARVLQSADGRLLPQ